MERTRFQVYDNDSLEWLAKNYIWQKGLRNWTWEVIIYGIIKENIKILKADGQEVDVKNIELVWLTYFKVAKVENLKAVPVTSDPDHPHVKAAMYLYSIESFIYKRINKISREKDTSSILTLGPFAVVLTRIIE